MTNEILQAEIRIANGVLYRGHNLSRPGGGLLVVIEAGGELVGLLPHHVMHSPTGMTWGYDGAGPADLARSLLIHALGDAARCAGCNDGWAVPPQRINNSRPTWWPSCRKAGGHSAAPRCSRGSINTWSAEVVRGQSGDAGSATSSAAASTRWRTRYQPPMRAGTPSTSAASIQGPNSLSKNIRISTPARKASVT